MYTCKRASHRARVIRALGRTSWYHHISPTSALSKCSDEIAKTMELQVLRLFAKVARWVRAAAEGSPAAWDFSKSAAWQNFVASWKMLHNSCTCFYRFFFFIYIYFLCSLLLTDRYYMQFNGVQQTGTRQLWESWGTDEIDYIPSQEEVIRPKIKYVVCRKRSQGVSLCQQFGVHLRCRAFNSSRLFRELRIEQRLVRQ